jgi:molecular chaperone GrpE
LFHIHEEVLTELDDKLEERPVEDTIEDQVDELTRAEAEAAEYLDQLQRVQAEFANYKKRTQREREEFVSLANAALIKQLLPILDDCERALQTVPDNLRGLTWVEGIALIERRLRTTLEQQGLTGIDAVGEKFDPQLHHAMVREETTERREDEIISEFQKGYRLHDKVLRPSMVRVAARPRDENTKSVHRKEDH